MAKVKDSQIEESLRKITREAKQQDDETFSVNNARKHVESQLRLDAGFLKNDAWKKRSAAIIKAVFEEETVEAGPNQTAPESTSTRKKQSKATPKPQQRSRKSEESVERVTAPADSVTQVSPQKENEDAKASEREDQDEDKDESSSEDGSGTESNSSGAEDEGRAAASARAPVRPQLKKPETVPPKVNGVKRKSGEQSSDTSESDSGDNEEEEHRKKRAKATSSSSSDEGSEDDSDDESSTSEDGEETVQEYVHPILSVTQLTLSSSQARNGELGTDNGTATDTIKAISPKAFKPPVGYNPVDAATSTNGTGFSPKDLGGKQIWHITAPSNVSLSSITEVAIDMVQSNQIVLSHKGIDYVLNEDKSEGKEVPTLMIATPNGHERIQHKIERRLQLQQKITLPNLSNLQASQLTGSNVAGNVAAAAVQCVRPQPKGLRMRYRPPGFGHGNPGRIGSGSDGTDEEDQPDVSPSFQFPKALGEVGTAVQQDGDVEMVDAAEAERSAKKPKKKRKEKSAPTPLTNGDSQADHTSHPVHESRGRENGSSSAEPKKSKATENSAQEGPSALPNGTLLESKDDRARRKEEKRLKRERKEAKKRAEDAAVT